MKNHATKRLLALLLTLAMLLPSFAGAIQSVSATTSEYTTGTATVYDIYDLTGESAKTIYGRVQTGTWDQQIGTVAEEHKGNVAFTAKMTVGSEYEHIFIGLGMTGANASSTTDGYIFEIQAKAGELDTVVYHKKDAAWQASSQDLTFDFNGTYVLEAGVVDLYENGTLVGKRAYLKGNGEEICHWDDLSPVTTENLGTVVGIYNEQNNITLETTYVNGCDKPNVYDIYDLTGESAKTIYGRVQTGTWDQQIGTVAEEHKGNVAFTAKMTVGSEYEHIFIGLGMTGANASSTTDGYIFEIQAKAGELDTVVYHKKDAAWQASSQNLTFDFNGTYVLEAGVVDLYENGALVGKRAYLKGNGEEICHWDDRSPVTTENLGTVVGIYNEQNNITLETTYESGFGDPNVYDIYDLTGSTTKAVSAWSPVTIGNFNEEDKENAAIRTVITSSGIKDNWDNIRLSLGAKADEDVTDPKGYALVTSVDANGVSYIHFKRSGNGLATYTLSADAVPGSALLNGVTLEFGYRSITLGEKIIGKRLYLSVNGVETYTYDDTDGFLTGDALGTKVGIFHYLGSLQMDSTYESAYGTAKVYDIYDLTGAASNTIKGTDETWDGQIFANISEEHKENFAFKTKLTMAAQNVRLSLTAKDGDSVTDPIGYAVYLYGAENAIDIRRGNSSLKYTLVEGLAGTYIFEVGIVDILFNGQVTGKHLYVKINDAVVCEYDDVSGYLTGDALGTKIIDFHYGAAIQMDTTYEFGLSEPNAYDIYDLTGAASNTFIGTDAGASWDYGQLVGNIRAEHKENMALRANVTIAEGEKYRLSFGALESVTCVDPCGYGFELCLGRDNKYYLAIVRNTQWLTSFDLSQEQVNKFNGTWKMEFGYQDILVNGNTVGKQICLKVDGEEIVSYKDNDGYLTGEALGTKIAVFTYGEGIQMDTTLPSFVDSYNLTLGGSTVMNLRLDPAVVGDAAATVTVSVGGVENTYTWQELPIDAMGLRTVSVPLAAAQMQDQVTLTVNLTDGTSMEKSYTVAGYAKVILSGSDYTAEQKAVVEAMLHYGAAAQNYFAYNVDNLANAGYNDAVTNVIGSSFAPSVTGGVDGVIYYGSSLLMRENISLRHYLNIEGDVSGYSFAFNGEAVTPVSTSKVSGANYYVQFDNILPNELDGVYVLTVSANGNTLTLDYSPMSYVQRMSEKEAMKELVQQLYDYHLAAKELAASKVVDEAAVLDLYQLANVKSVTVPDDQVMQVGVLVGTDDSFTEKELTGNVAVRFRYTANMGMRFQLGANMQQIGGTSGALFLSVPANNSFGIANISDNGYWQQDAAGNDIFSWQECLGEGQVSYIELGCVRRYTDGVYTHDRYYVRAAATLEELDQMAQNGTFSVYYDTTMKDNLGSLVILRERMSGDGDILETTWTDAQIDAYEARINAIAQSATSGSYDQLEKKYPALATDTSNTAASAAIAATPDTTQATGGDELILWAESGTAKIVLDDDGKAATLASGKNVLNIQMAKNEDEGAQLMLFANRNVEAYEVFVTDLVSGGNVISADNIRLYQLKYLTVDDKASGYYDTPGDYVGEKLPDGMLPFAKAVEYGENVILAGNNQAIYVDVSTKSTDAAGTYTGTIVVKTAEQVYTLPVSVTVQDVTLPDVSQLGTYAPCLDRDSFTTGELDGSDEMAALYMEALQDFHMSTVSPIFNGEMNMERFLVDVRRNYSQVSNYLLPVDNSDSYYTVDGTVTPVYCNYALLKEYVVALARMSVADGVNYLDKAFFYPSDHADESNTEAEFNVAKATYKAFCQMLDDADAELTAIYAGTGMYTSNIADSVKNLRFLLTIPSGDDNGRTLNVGTLLTDFLESADRKNVVLSTTNDVLVREEYGDEVASAMNGAYADELWTYLCLSPYTPYSNYAFDTPVVGLRALGWTCYQENIDTLMAWSSVNYLYGAGGQSLDRWTTSSAGTNMPTPGDSNLFYPGAKYGIDGPCPSLRAMAWRDGVEDYSLMCAVTENGGSADSLNSLYGLITEDYTDSVKASPVTDSWWGTLFSKNVDATVPVTDDAKFTIVRNALLQMAASDASQHAAIISNAETAISGVVTAAGTVDALEAPAAESAAAVKGNIYTDGYYQIADFESYAETVQNKFSGNAQLALSGNASSGDYSLKVTVRPGQKGETVWIPTTSKYFSATTNFSGASKVTFMVYNAQSTDSTVRFYLNTYDRSGDVYNLGTYYKGEKDIWHEDYPGNTSLRFTLAPGWNEITVNAEDIGTDHLSYVGAFIIAFDSGVGCDAAQVFYLDDVRVYMNKVN